MNRENRFSGLFGKLRRPVALLAALFLMVGVAVGGTVAYFSVKSETVTNTFKPTYVATKVEETRSGAEKKDVTIKNTGTTAAWIRAAVVVTWQDEKGNVYGKAPKAGTDYTISMAGEADWGTSGAWLDGDDNFYYWSKPVKENESAGLLIKSIQAADTAPDGYSLAVEVLGSGIQCQPESVFNDMWKSSGLTADGGVLAKPQGGANG